jgi:hypothetical protein
VDTDVSQLKIGKLEKCKKKQFSDKNQILRLLVWQRTFIHFFKEKAIKFKMAVGFKMDFKTCLSSISFTNNETPFHNFMCLLRLTLRELLL